MDENPKNPSQLTDEDRSIVDRIFISCIVVMDRLMIKYCTPEDYVKKFALSAISSDKKFATGRIIINSNNKYDGPVPPNRINEDLALEAEIFRPTDEDTSALDKFLHPRDMTEVIKILEREGVLEVIRGKKQIKSRFGLDCLAYREDRRTGGRPSVSKITKPFEKVRKVMAKQEARNLLREKLLELPVTIKFERFILKTSLILITTDESYTEKLLRLVAPSQDLQQLVKSQPSRHLLIQSLNSLSDEQIEAFIDQNAKSIALARPYDLYYLFSLVKYGEE